VKFGECRKMRRENSEEILGSKECSAIETEKSLRDLCRINRWFGGVGTTRTLIARVASRAGLKRMTLLEVASGFGEVPRAAGLQLARRGISLDITDLDRVPSHLLPQHRALVADAVALPFRDSSFDVVSCNLFAHHLQPEQLRQFAVEALRVSRHALIINDLIRHPLHLALVYAGFPLMRSYVSRVDGVASVKRAYTPEEIREIISGTEESKIDVSTHYLFRMGVILWKSQRISNQRPMQTAA
jgi:ubiquinone/menaquinone biosynthesis C-methylase UbiE